MTQEEKNLLLTDLCARLPYRTVVNFTLGDISFDKIVSSVDVNGDNVQVYTKHGFLRCPLEGDPEIELSQIKPYLRSLESMTEDEEREFEETLQYTQYTLESYDWLNAHHFDYRGLIPMGLALEVPKDMYKSE